MKQAFLPFWLALTLLLSGCATKTPQYYLNHYEIKAPQVDGFEICRSAGCRRTSKLSYTKEEWFSIEKCFEPIAQDAATEREYIRLAIALMEQINGPKNDTYRDNPRNIIRGARGGQLDCIAEAVNTTVALILLEREGLLQYHTAGYPQHRGFARLKLPHNTASILENSNGAHYVVDSWFFANGELPEITSVTKWKNGFYPDSPL